MSSLSQDLSHLPFGKYQLPWWARTLVNLCQVLPANGIGKKVAFIIRKPVLRWHAGPMDVCLNGLRCRLHPSQNLSDKRLLTTPHLLDGVERTYFKKCLSPHAIVVDVGANVGGYTLLLLRERPDLEVLAIEADPRLSIRLSDNLRLSGFDDRCEIHNVAVTDKPGVVNLFQHPENQGRNSLTSEGDSASTVNSITVNGQPLLSILDDSGIERAELLKMDIEGHEYPVLQAFFESAPKRRWPTYIQIEQYRREEINQAVSLCLANGYQITLRTRMNVVLECPSGDHEETSSTPVAAEDAK